MSRPPWAPDSGGRGDYCPDPTSPQAGRSRAGRGRPRAFRLERGSRVCPQPADFPCLLTWHTSCPAFGEEGKVMLTEILSVAFLVGVPIWLVVEHVLHRSHIRAKAARLIEVRRPGRRTVAADRLTHAA